MILLRCGCVFFTAAPKIIVFGVTEWYMKMRCDNLEGLFLYEVFLEKK